MKILSLKLNGINSIVGKSAASIDFENTKIASQGLFAITGPTGSGKSTLLDAISLAIYGYTPRLGKVAPSNVSEILNRKSVEGFAEIEYMVDGERYLSRWSAHRANKKLTGNIRTEVILQHLQGEDWVVLQSGLEPWRKENETRTGLSFKNFKYSILLAQGQFADFIQGSDVEKAEILKTLTHTDEFSDLGRMCFQVHKDLATELKVLTADADIQNDDLYTADELIDTKKEIEKIYENQSQVKDKLERSRLWLEEEKTWAELLIEQKSFDELSNKFKIELDEFKTEQEKLIQHRRVEKLVPLDQDLNSISERLVQAGAVLKSAQEDQEVLLHKVEDVENQLTLFQAEEALLKQTTLEFREWSEKVRAPTQKIEHLKSQNSEAQESLDQSLIEQKKWKTNGDDLKLEIETIESQMSDIGRWIALYPNGLSLKSQLGPWIGEIAQELNRCKDISNEEQKLKDLRVSLSEAHSKSNDQLRDIEPVRKKIELQKTKIETLEDLIQENKSRSENKKSEMESNQHNLQQELVEATEYSELEMEMNLLLENLKNYRDELSSLDQKQKSLDTKKIAANNLRNSRFDLVKTKKEILKLLAFKHLLEKDEPCPLCGGLDHDGKHGNVPQDLIEFELDLTQAENALLEIETEAKLLLDSQNKTSFDHKSTDERVDFLKNKLEFEGGPLRWAHRLAVKQEEFKIHEVSYQEYLKDLKEQENKAVELRRMKAENIRFEIESEDSEIAILESQKRIDKLEWTLDEQKSKLEFDQKWLVTQNKKWSGRLLSPSFQGWKGLRELKTYKDREVFQSEAELWLKDFEDKNRIKLEQQKLHHGKQVEQRQIKAAGGQIETRLLQAQSKFDKLNTELEQAVVGLTQLLNGRVVDEEAQKLKVKEEILTKTKSHLEVSHNDLQKSKAALAQTIELKSLEVENLNKQFISKDIQLKQRLNGLEIESIEIFRTLLLASADHESLTSQEQKMREEEIRLSESQKSIQHRTHKCLVEIKQAWGRFKEEEFEVFENTAQIFCEKFNKQIEILNKKLWHLQAKIKLHEELQDEMGELLKKIKSKEKEKNRWGKLESLIGGADGAKFNQIAQSLNLRRLIVEANEFLRQLSSRYTLEVDDSQEIFGLKLIVIDQEQDYQVRQLVNLSGGETFQLSLALALGLSELSSGGCQLESLFIDEGFGTLDQETLAQVLVALQGLKATGKTVGIITHVSGIREHIPYGVELKVHVGGRGEVVILD